MGEADLVPYFAFEDHPRQSSCPKSRIRRRHRILASAAALAKNSDVAIVFVYRWETEGDDAPSLALPENQDALIAKVAAANPHTIVVLETGNPVSMPWVDQVSGIVEAWFAGTRGAEALANVLFGDVNPSGKLPLTFPKNEADLPHTTIVKPPKESLPPSEGDSWTKILEGLTAFQTTYDEGLKVGYKWYDAEKKPVLFPFGYGLSYTSLTPTLISKVMPGENRTREFHCQKHGKRAGAEVAEVYASLPTSAGEPPSAWWVGQKKLNPGESKDVTVEVEPYSSPSSMPSNIRVAERGRRLHLHGGWFLAESAAQGGSKPEVIPAAKCRDARRCQKL